MKTIPLSQNPYVHIITRGGHVEIIQIGKEEDARVFDRNGNDITEVKKACDSITEHGRQIIDKATIK